MLTNKDVFLCMRGKLYRRFVEAESCMLHGSKTWFVNKENLSELI